MQGFNINDVQAPPNTVQGQVIPPTGGGGWAMNCQPGIDGTTPDADMFNDLIGNLLRLCQRAGIKVTPNRYDDVADAVAGLIAQTGTAITQALAKVAFTGNYGDLKNPPAIPPALGFTPVQQGGGVSQGNNKVYIGWDGGGLRATIDSTDEGRFVFEPELQANVSNLQSEINGLSGEVNSLSQQVSGGANYAAQAGNGIASMAWSQTPVYSNNGASVVDYLLVIVFANGESRTIATTTKKQGDWYNPQNYTSFNF